MNLEFLLNYDKENKFFQSTECNRTSPKRVFETNEIDVNKRRKFILIETTINEVYPEVKIDIPENPPVIPHHLSLDEKTKKILTKKSSLPTDITPLLVLPQKLAARKLGLSESLLCKRYKESTNQKWPYRMINKLEKEISMCSSDEELSYLLSQKNQFIKPVSIKIRRYMTQYEINYQLITSN
eukprot:TRINITY_DN1201_c0_g1_i1.p1 TRINITY_DN1201_c0_g1~~TRINITY_DN1201_c0_g1_i1.p1  ORF type:complete len:190 (-),score=48.83 TRINITY_DN1201_c0_g1_i1:64-612(-)